MFSILLFHCYEILTTTHDCFFQDPIMVPDLMSTVGRKRETKSEATRIIINGAEC